jgi:starch-binding outer membrane protein, SusD/RagB family
MKKKNILIALLAISTVSCTDSFLEEEMVSTITQDYFETEQGLDQLVVSSYNALRIRHGYREGVYSFETGHDCALKSGDTEVNEYSTSFWNSTSLLATTTNEFMGFQSKTSSGFLINSYPIIDNCNKAITSIRSGSAQGDYASDASYAAKRLSEVLFNRDYLFYSLNTLLGDIYVPTTSITSLPDNYDYPREPSATLWEMMITDMRYAYENLPESVTGSDYGRITKYAAAHFLSKLYLQRAQGANYGSTTYGRNADGTIDNSNSNSYLGMLYKGSVSTDLDSCVYYASKVIDSGYYELEDDYAAVFNHPLDDYTNESSKELILQACYGSGTADNYRYGVRILCLFVGNYVNSMYGIPSYTWENETKPNFYFHNSDWGYDVFTNKQADTRYQKSFHLEYTTSLMGGTTSSPGADEDYYAYNNASNTTYLWTADQAEYFNNNILPTYARTSWGGRQAVTGQHKMGTGDLAFAILENTKETAISVEEADAQPFVLYARWMKDGSKYYYRPQIVASGKTYSFKGATNFYGFENSSLTGSPCSTKYNDPNRTSYNSAYGTRDVPIYRLSETYLIRAEAYGRKGDYASAIKDINVVRARAAFKAGDTRDEVLARLYPGNENLSSSEKQYPYTVATDMTSTMAVDASYWDGSSANSIAEDYPSYATTTEQRFVEFIYNEYAREFNEELMYYEGIHHAGIQAQRIQWHNQMGSSASEHSSLWTDASDNVSGTNGQTGLAKGNFQNYMTFKPFPQTFLDMLTDENGTLLDDAAKASYQNYGY